MAKKPARSRRDSASGKSNATAKKSTPRRLAKSATAKPATSRKTTRRSPGVTVEDFAASIASVPASELRTLFNYNEPFVYKPHTENLSELRMELDDIQVLRYLFRNAQPLRHLEFGTWEGRGALACLEECDASVWTINLLDGEQNEEGMPAYARIYSIRDRNELAGVFTKIGNDKTNDAEMLSYQTDAFGFIGRYIRAAGLNHRVCQIYADSREWDASVYPENFFDSVLIDGGHDPETVINDTRKALSRLRPGGLIIWHDFCPDSKVYGLDGSSCQGVVRGLSKIWDEVSSDLTECRWVEGSWLLVGMRAGEPVRVSTPTGLRDGESLPGGRRAQEAALRSDIAALRRELDGMAKYREERAALDDALTKARSDNAVLEKRVINYATIVHERDALRMRIETLEKNARTEIAGQERRAARAEEELGNREAAVKRLEEQLAVRRQEAEAAITERDGLRREISAQIDRLTRLEAQAAERTETLEALRGERAELEAELARRERRIEVLEEKERALSEELATKTQAMLGHNQQNEALADEIAALCEVRDTMETRNAKLAADAAQLRDANSALMQERAEREDLLAATREEVEEARKEVDLRAREAGALESRVAELGRSVTELGTVRDELESALAERGRALEERQAALEERERVIDGMNSRLTELATAVADGERNGAALNAELGAARTVLTQLQQARSSLVADVGRQKRELAALSGLLDERTAELSAMGDRIAMLVSERDRFVRRVAEVDKALRAAEVEKSDLQSENQTISADLTLRRREVVELGKVRDGLVGEIMQQKRALAHFDRVMSDVKRENENLRAAINDYTNSHSWRITAPLRMVSSLFRR